MYNNNVEILLIDDEVFHTDITRKKLLNLGFTNIVIKNTYSEALEFLDISNPDVIILDYYLDKSHTGAELVKEVLLNKDIPLIFISAFYGEEIFKDIIAFAPMDFIPKNVSEFDLDKAIKLALIKKKENHQNAKLKEFIFVKYSKEIRKLAVDDIEYIMVDGKYLILFSDQKKYLIRSSLNDFLKKLPEGFIKIHQAYIINLRFLVSIKVEEGIVKLANVSLPFSRNHKKELLNAYYLP